MYEKMCVNVKVETRFYSTFCIFSSLFYVINVTLHHLMLHRFEIHSALELSRAALLCCRLAASRLHEAARWQSSLTLRIFASSKVKFSSFSIDTTTYQMN